MSTNIDVVKAVDAAFASNNTEEFLSYCNDDISWKMVGDKTLKGKQEIREFLSQNGGSAPVFNSFVVFGDDKNVSSTGSMKMKGENGEDREYEYCDVYKFSNEKISEMSSYCVKIG